MKKLLHGMILAGALLAVAHPANASEGAQADDAHAASKERSDESIQAVLDNHKQALYEIYVGELKQNPKAQGRVMLRITIAPDGHVSSCGVKRTTMNSSALLRKIKDAVCSFNFGAQRGVAVTSILYPMDFLPPN